jgi:hypothetical protein
MKATKGISLKEALEKMLGLAEQKLYVAVNKCKDWDINHYKKDIVIIKEQLKGL